MSKDDLAEFREAIAGMCAEDRAALQGMLLLAADRDWWCRDILRLLCKLDKEQLRTVWYFVTALAGKYHPKKTTKGA